MQNSDFIGVQAEFDLAKFEDGQNKYIASMDTMASSTAKAAGSMSDSMAGAGDAMDNYIAEFRAGIAQMNKDTDAMLVDIEETKRLTEVKRVLSFETTRSATATKQAATATRQAASNTRTLADGLNNTRRGAVKATKEMARMSRVVEALGGPSMTPLVSKLNTTRSLLMSLSMLGKGTAVSLGALGVGGAIGAGITELLYRGGVIQTGAAELPQTAGKVGAMAAGGASGLFTFVTSLGDTEKAVRAGNKAFVDASVSLGVMTDAARDLTYIAQGWKGAEKDTGTIRSLAQESENYAKKLAEQRKQEQQRADIITRHNKQIDELTKERVDDELKTERDHYKSRVEAMRNYGLEVMRAEEDFQQSRMFAQQRYSLSMSDAIGRRDVTAAVRLKQQYDMERIQANVEHNTQQRRRSEDAANELQELERNYAEAQVVRDNSYQTELDKLRTSRDESLQILDDRLKAEAAAQKQYAADIAAFWEQQRKNFPATQAFQDFNFPIPEAPAEAYRYNPETQYRDSSLPKKSVTDNAALSLAITGITGGIVHSEIQRMFEAAIENVLADVFSEGARGYR